MSQKKPKENRIIEEEKVVGENSSRTFLSENLAEKNKNFEANLNENEKQEVKKLTNKKSKIEKAQTTKKTNAPKAKQNVDIAQKIKLRIDQSAQEAKEIAKENKDELKTNAAKTLEEAKEEVKRGTSRNRVYFYVFCLLLNLVGFSLILLLLSSSAINLTQALKNGSTLWFILAVLSIFAILLLDTGVVYLLLKGTSRSKRFVLSFKTVAIGKYYDCITPLKTGGQPFQIAYLHRFGERGSSSTSVPMTRFVINQFIYILFIVFLVFNVSKIKMIDDSIFTNIINIVAYVGLAIQVLWLLTILLLSYSKRIGPALVIGVLKTLAFFRIVKNYRKAYVKVLKFVKEYQITMKRCLNNTGRFLLTLLYSVSIMVIKWSIPFLLYCAFCGYNSAFFYQCFVYNMLLELAVGFWILPGNVIFADLVFLTLYRPMFGSGLIFWALLFWRLLSYYGYIAIGFIVKFYDFLKYEYIPKHRSKKLSKNFTKLQNK